MKLIQIQSNKLSHKRTRERVKANGPEFELIEWSASCIALQGDAGFLVKSVSTGWMGWLIENEITVIE